MTLASYDWKISVSKATYWSLNSCTIQYLSLHGGRIGIVLQLCIIEGDYCFGEIYRSYFYGNTVLHFFNLEDGGNILLRNNCNHLQC
jgi:hypothetical protein